MSKRTLLATISVLAGVTGCLITGTDPRPRQCQTDADCPKDFYTCVPSGLDGTRVCEVIYPPPFLAAIPGDGGAGDDGGTGATPYYCSEIKPILNRSCVSNCHGTDTSQSAQTTFRLDIYEDLAGIFGAKTKADRVKVRTLDSSMPPPPAFLELPSAAQRVLVGRWVDLGAPLSANGQPCDQQPPPPPPPGDAGTDAGLPPVTYAQIQAIFNARCDVACHLKDTPTGGLDLRAASNSCLNLKNNNANCNAGKPRVSAGSLVNSEMWLMIDANAARGGTCGIMPNTTAGLKTVNNAEYQLITRWIQEGATCL